MNTIKVRAVSILVAALLSIVMAAGQLRADEAAKVRSAGFRNEDDAIKAAIRANKARIDEERNAILEDGRQIRQARKAGDKEKVELLNQDIKRRKAAIRALKDDINQKEGGLIDYGSGVKRRAR